jgi:cytoskeleton protein RodZ
MSASQVEALENADYERLPRGTFLRGFIRNYAKVLGLDVQPLLGALAEERPDRTRPGIVVASQNIRFDPLGQRTLANPYVKAAGLATVAVVIAFAAMYWWLFIRPAPPALAAKKPAVADAPKAALSPPQPAEAPPPVMAPTEPAKPEPAPAAVAEPRKPEPAKPEAAKAEPAKAEPPRPAPAVAAAPVANPAAAIAPAQPIDPAGVIAAGGSVLRLKFRGSSWVEIKDGKGKILLSRVNPAGSDAEVVGKGPFSVVVGNAPEVSLSINDRAFDLEPHTRVAVARFTIQ